MAEKFEVQREKDVVYVDRTKSNSFATNAMMTAVCVILVGIVFAYLATFEGSFDFSAKNITANGVLLLIACYAVRYLCKHISMNKARKTKEYEDAEKEAKSALEKIEEKGYSLRISAYTRAYSERLYNNTVDRVLRNARIPISDWIKYAAKSKKEIKKEFPYVFFSKIQWKAIKTANKIKRSHYDESFLQTTTETSGGGLTPSEASNVSKIDKKDDFKSFCIALSFALFSCSLTGMIIYDLSRQAIILMIIKIITTLISGALAISFGWDLVMKKEIGRFKRQKSEASNCIKWCEEQEKGEEKE